MPEPSIPSHETALLGMKAWTLVAGFAGGGVVSLSFIKALTPMQSVWLMVAFVAIYIAVVAFNARNYERMWSDAN